MLLVLMGRWPLAWPPGGLEFLFLIVRGRVDWGVGRDGDTLEGVKRLEVIRFQFSRDLVKGPGPRGRGGGGEGTLASLGHHHVAQGAR